ncbi:hypothetical protein [Jiella marina]|uniref:hypothetical protein n=1 Tax=Jiella sp. LLJ827 TaxID=2917712 RepID=UPI0021013E81|nr:hypothetical protein [Jiella sp. LLJ827]MCQ0989615.1 hypothetical protein [Jiella sp. LLJ827]
MMQTPANMNQPGSMFGLNLETINSWVNGIYLSSVAIAAVCSVLIFAVSAKISAEKDRQIAEFRTAAQAEISSAQEAAAVAGARAAEANERSAILEKEAKFAQLEAERIKKSVAWRALTANQVRSLSSSLKINTGSVNLRFMDGDPEALYFALQIGRVLNDSGWNVAMGSTKPGNFLAFGIWVSQETHLARALAAADIPFTPKNLPPQTSVSHSNLQTIQGAPFFFVGSRRPLAFQ